MVVVGVVDVTVVVGAAVETDFAPVVFELVVFDVVLVDVVLVEVAVGAADGLPLECGVSDLPPPPAPRP